MKKHYLFVLFAVEVFCALGFGADVSDDDHCPVNYNPLRKTRQAAFQQSLYKEGDGIIEVDVNSLGPTVLNSDTAHLVEFYNFWCGHCRKFAPTYVRFAKDVERWSSVVKIVAINCADERNGALCTTNGVQFVPFLKYFRRHSSDYSEGIELSAHHSVAKLRRDLTQQILNEYASSPDPDWPNFTFLPPLYAALWSGVPADVQYVAVVFDADNSSYVGAQLLLDLSSESSWIAGRRAQQTHPFAETLNIVDFPTVAVFARGNSTPFFVSEVRRLLLNQIVDFKEVGSFENLIGTGQNSETTTVAPTTPRKETPFDRIKKKNKYFVSETDILLATWYALYHEVPFASGDIAGDNFTHLNDFVLTLKKYFPQTEDVRSTLRFLSLDSFQNLSNSQRARLVFADLASFLEGKTSIPAKEWKQEFSRLEQIYGNPFPRNASWVHCQGSSARFRGYTCGLWTAFHTLTAHAYLEDGLRPDFDPLAVPKSIQGWVRSFFGCNHCARHFIRMTTQQIPMEEWIRYPSDVVLYLWKAHNTVNARLKDDRTEDPSFPKLQFPAKFLCDSCHEFKGATNETQWNTRQVMKYLLRFYTRIVPHGANRTTELAASAADFIVPIES